MANATSMNTQQIQTITNHQSINQDICGFFGWSIFEIIRLNSNQDKIKSEFYAPIEVYEKAFWSSSSWFIVV